MTHPTDHPGDLRSLISGILTEGRALLRTELQLARRELSDNAARAGWGLVLFGIAALVALIGLGTLAAAAVLAVAAMGLPYHWSALIVAVACMAVAIILALIGKSRLASSTFAPKRTLKQVKSDIDAVKEMARA